MKKAVFFDIDGTLIDVTKGQTHITHPVRKALRRLQQGGHRIFLATGRPYAYLDAELLSFGFDGFVLMNGALVLLDDQEIFRDPLPKDRVEELCRLAEQEHVEYILQGSHHVYLRPDYRLMEDFYTGINISLELFVREFDSRKLDIFKLEFFTERTDVDELYQSMIHMPGMTGITDPFHLKNLELYAEKNTKATGILHALEYLGIPVEESYAFGDGLNDVEMLQTVGHGLAMDNGHPDLKAVADAVVPSIHEDGVAAGIYEYVLGGGAR
ncbi:MAG: HAD family hydrolase [Selenomonadaceae bacterium]|nr:HAD family hydrolase [Selenomonadaceae bacterium]